MVRIFLIVADDPLAASAKVALEREGHAVAVAPSASVAFDALHWFSPDLILIDADLPGGEAAAALGRFKRRGAPMLVLSFEAQARTVARLAAAGATGFLTKPINPDRLVRAVNTAVAGARKSKAASPKPADAAPSPGVVLL